MKKLLTLLMLLISITSVGCNPKTAQLIYDEGIRNCPETYINDKTEVLGLGSNYQLLDILVYYPDANGYRKVSGSADIGDEYQTAISSLKFDAPPWSCDITSNKSYSVDNKLALGFINLPISAGASGKLGGKTILTCKAEWWKIDGYNLIKFVDFVNGLPSKDKYKEAVMRPGSKVLLEGLFVKDLEVTCDLSKDIGTSLEVALPIGQIVNVDEKLSYKRKSGTQIICSQKGVCIYAVNAYGWESLRNFAESIKTVDSGNGSKGAKSVTSIKSMSADNDRNRLIEEFMANPDEIDIIE